MCVLFKNAFCYNLSQALVSTVDHIISLTQTLGCWSVANNNLIVFIFPAVIFTDQLSLITTAIKSRYITNIV